MIARNFSEIVSDLPLQKPSETNVTNVPLDILFEADPNSTHHYHQTALVAFYKRIY